MYFKIFNPHDTAYIKFKMDHRPKCKFWNIKLVQENLEETLFGLQ